MKRLTITLITVAALAPLTSVAQAQAVPNRSSQVNRVTGTAKSLQGVQARGIQVVEPRRTDTVAINPTNNDVESVVTRTQTLVDLDPDTGVVATSQTGNKEIGVFPDRGLRGDDTLQIQLQVGR